MPDKAPLCVSDWEEVERGIGRIRSAIYEAAEKHGRDQTPINPEMAFGEKLAILGEEFGEVCRALTYDEGGNASKLRKELRQLAAMALLWEVSLT